jgi:ribosomal protein L3
LLNFTAFAQSDVITNVRTAMKTGSSKELSRHFNEMVELNINGNKSSYSKTQAEFVLKDFFKNNPPVDFQYVHQGASKEGIKYAIGKYTYNDGSFRVLVLVKQIKGNYLVDLIDFSKE